jgi:hypothetical protein
MSRAERIALTIPDSARSRALGSQLKQVIPDSRRRRAAAARRGSKLPRFSPGFHKALAHLAVTAAGGSGALATPRLSAAPQFGPTVTNGQPGGHAPVRAGDAQRLLTEAERVASGLPEPGDDRADALCEMQLVPHQSTFAL